MKADVYLNGKHEKQEERDKDDPVTELEDQGVSLSVTDRIFVLFVMLLTLPFFALFVFLLLYFIKTALGIDIFPGCPGSRLFPT